ncbi:ABC transporter ATP-binding protein [Herbaspirillum rhizosphaerae]|uniref:ABC transporter ATP-binding protein n=1 Tax=Herbaspirillum rhizosphaerae TaxID=346179 RepID=UPI00067CDC4D|nr:ABC transporter ATP-binding protein [Herbaspirillum rhizosphaerae]
MNFLFSYIGPRRVGRFIAVALLLSVFDLVGIAAIFPYLKVISEPSSIQSSRVLSWVYQQFGFTGNTLFLYVLSAGMLVFFTVKAGLSLWLNRSQLKGLAELAHELTSDLFGKLMRARYDFFLRQAPSELVGMNYTYSSQVAMCFQAWLGIVAEAIFFGLFFCVSFYLQPLATGIVCLTVLLVGAALYFLIIKRIVRYGKEQARVDGFRYRWSFATISSIKDARIMGLGDMFLARTVELSSDTKNIAWRNGFATSLPRFTIEYVIIVVFVIAAAMFVESKMSIENMLPVFGLMALCAMRVLPAFGRFTAYYSGFKYSKTYLDKLQVFYEELRSAHQDVVSVELPFNNSLTIRDLDFSYGEKQILRNLSMTIQRGSSVGIVGASGSGKSTLLDIITGLQEKASGLFLLDKEEIDPYSTNAIRRYVGYVPQQIALIDESIAFNISFSHEYDAEKIKRVLKVANLDVFVNSLDDGMDTFVGEAGVRLSGGQRQRLGIARALYRDPEILIFDESTSALDNITEKELSDEILALAGNKTLIIVAHRLTTVMGCDVIYVMEHGKIVASGTHDELMRNSPLYRAMQHPGQAVDVDEAMPLSE